MKRNNKTILIICLSILFILFLTFILKDTFLEKLDFLARKNAMTKAYNNRTILTEKDEKGFYKDNNFPFKLTNLKVEENTLSFDLLFNKDYEAISKTNKLSLNLGINILENDKQVVYRNNFMLPEVANANKCNIFSKVSTNKKRSINPYAPNNLNENYDLTLDKQNKFYELVKENDMYKATISFKLKENVKKENLKISLNEFMILDGSNLLLYNFEHFTEYKI